MHTEVKIKFIKYSVRFSSSIVDMEHFRFSAYLFVELRSTNENDFLRVWLVTQRFLSEKR